VRPGKGLIGVVLAHPSFVFAERTTSLHRKNCIVSKRADAPYKSERSEAWPMVKTVLREKFPVVGFVKDPSGVAALYLGKHEGGELRYMGKFGTGWNRTTSSQIRKQLEIVVSPKSKLTKPVRKPKKRRGRNRCSTLTLSTGT
jgi:ATP-dependent DNA ligase